MHPETERAYRNLFAGIVLQALHDVTKAKPIATYSDKVRAKVQSDARSWLDNHGYGVFDWLDLDPDAIDGSLYRLIDCS